ncbi:MAG: hypothetical protein ABH828_02055 [archaeon]
MNQTMKKVETKQSQEYRDELLNNYVKIAIKVIKSKVLTPRESLWIANVCQDYALELTFKNKCRSFKIWSNLIDLIEEVYGESVL